MGGIGPVQRRSAFLGMAVLAIFANSVAGQLAWDESQWEVQAQESRVEEFLGREALYVRGGNVWLRNADFPDGTIEFDISATAERGFNGLRFRAVDRFNHEHVYMRPHLSGKPDAVQYTPVFDAVSAWQLYSDPRFVLPAVLTPGPLGACARRPAGAAHGDDHRRPAARLPGLGARSGGR